MILEHAILQVKPGQENEFQAAMNEALPLIAASPGFGGIEIRANAERANTYLLLVKWQSVAAHRDGFRKSDRYAKWKYLLHHFYDPMPEVSYLAEPFVAK